jgi:nicotinate-nucleotide adenylyltransferase
MRKIGIFGGTFNPVHVGHLRSAVEVCQGFGLDAVYLVPSASPPHKPPDNLAPAADRLAMVARAVENRARLRVSDLELKRPGPSFTIDTVCAFRKHLPAGVWLYLIMGVDAFREIETWKSYRELLHLAPLIILDRPGSPPSLSGGKAAVEDLLRTEALDGYECEPDAPCYRHCEQQPIFVYNVTPLDISSTRIRKLLGQGEPIDFLVPEVVQRYIVEKGLYV